MRNQYNSYVLVFFISMLSFGEIVRGEETPSLSLPYSSLLSADMVDRLDGLVKKITYNHEESVTAFCSAVHNFIRSKEGLLFGMSQSQTDMIFDQMENNEDKINFLKNHIFYYYNFLDSFSDYLENPLKKEETIEVFRKMLVFTVGSFINQTLFYLDNQSGTPIDNTINSFLPILRLLGFSQKDFMTFIDTLKQIHGQLLFLKSDRDSFSYNYCTWKVSEIIAQKIVSPNFFHTYFVTSLAEHCLTKHKEQVMKLQSLLTNTKKK
jgi:hypothetical protein